MSESTRLDPQVGFFSLLSNSFTDNYYLFLATSTERVEKSLDIFVTAGRLPHTIITTKTSTVTRRNGDGSDSSSSSSGGLESPFVCFLLFL